MKATELIEALSTVQKYDPDAYVEGDNEAIRIFMEHPIKFMQHDEFIMEKIGFSLTECYGRVCWIGYTDPSVYL
jgi:hypothetical protein